MEIIIIILIIVGAYYLLNSQSTSTNIKKRKSNSLSVPSNIPTDSLNKEFDRMVDAFASGEFADNFDSSLLLKKGERLIFSIPSIEYCEERKVKVKGGYQGFSVRIMKGVSYRFGSFEATAEKRVVQIDNGNLILTNKRLVFSGDTKSNDYPLSKIVTIDALEDGVVINKSGKQKMEYYIGTNNVSIKIVSDEKDSWEGSFPYELRGEEIIKIIQKLIQE
tara:strand:+ start:165 stop:824 length:660 start_codon:yes stop_codon:yes gene_type:complete